MSNNSDLQHLHSRNDASRSAKHHPIVVTDRRFSLAANSSNRLDDIQRLVPPNSPQQQQPTEQQILHLRQQQHQNSLQFQFLQQQQQQQQQQSVYYHNQQQLFFQQQQQHVLLQQQQQHELLQEQETPKTQDQLCRGITVSDIQNSTRPDIDQLLRGFHQLLGNALRHKASHRGNDPKGEWPHPSHVNGFIYALGDRPIWTCIEINDIVGFTKTDKCSNRVVVAVEDQSCCSACHHLKFRFFEACRREIAMHDGDGMLSYTYASMKYRSPSVLNKRMMMQSHQIHNHQTRERRMRDTITSLRSTSGKKGGGEPRTKRIKPTSARRIGAKVRGTPPPSLGLARKSKTKSAQMGASAATDGSSVHSDFDKDADCSSSSGGSSGKSGKSGGRVLVVPGTEEYVNGVGMGKRRKLGNELIREEQTDDTMVTDYDDSTEVDVDDGNVTAKGGTGSSSISSKSGKSGGSGSSMSGKSGRSSSSSCKPKTKDTCDSSSSSSGKSGKSSGGSGKSKDATYGDGTDNDATGSSPSGDGSSRDSACTCSSGKSGKSGGGKSGGGSGKSGDICSNDGSNSSCSCDRKPTVCEPKPTTPAPTTCIREDQPWKFDTSTNQYVRGCEYLDIGSDAFGTLNEDKCCETNFPNDTNSCQMDDKCPAPTPAPTPCICEDQPWKFDMSANQCVRGCEYLDIGSDMFGTLNEDKCCDTHFLDQGCIVNDKCPPPSITTPEPTFSPTTGSTPKVSTEITGPPTKGTRSSESRDEDGYLV